MGSLTVRNLSEDVKQRLRQRAAANGRSMEEEIRLLLAESAADMPAARAQSAAKAVATSAKPARAAAAHQTLLIIAGGIAAYKSLDLIRRLRERGIAVRVVMTKAAQEFITPMSVGAIAGEHPFTELFDPSEFDVGHIRLARDNDLIVVAPATADIMARMANGHADDLASAVLLATDSQVLLAPAMNPRMWTNKATQRNVKQLLADGVLTVGPNSGEMAESGEAGFGRMAEPLEIVAAIEKLLQDREAEGGRQAPRGQTHRHYGGPHPRTDRSGALHREPLVRQARLRHRARSSGGRRQGHTRVGPGDVARPARREDRARRKRARDARRRRSGAAGGCRRVRRRGRGLAHGRRRRAEIEEGWQRPAAA
jgi:plasmid stability protein/3-polyprenyl-4-hydroxybenzoate decarboxylase